MKPQDVSGSSKASLYPRKCLSILKKALDEIALW